MPLVEIKCSKPFSQLTSADFTDDCFNCGARFSYIRQMRVSNQGVSWNYEASSTTPIYTASVSQRDYYTSAGSLDGMYSRAIIVACPEGSAEYTSGDDVDPGYKISKANHGNWRVVTSVTDIKKLTVAGSATNLFDSIIDGAGDAASVDASTADKQAALKDYYFRSSTGGIEPAVYYDSIDRMLDGSNNAYYLKVCFVTIADDQFFIRGTGFIGPYDHFQNRATYGDGFFGQGYYDFDTTSYMLQYCPQLWAASDINLKTGLGLKWVDSSHDGTKEYSFSDSEGYGIKFELNIVGSWYLHAKIKRSISMLMMDLAQSGLFFTVNSILYKPVIINGVVEGYTADMTVESEFDDWTDIKNHDVPVTPPDPPVPPKDDEDNDDPLSAAGAPFGTGLAHYYISTVDGAALTQISEAMSTWNIDATKKDLYRNLISCKIVKPPTAVPATPGVFEIYGVKPQYQGADITINEVTGNPDISFGPYNIDRKFGDFRDRAPYSKVEIFLPYCGWAALPAHVIGRSVSVTYYSDIIAGTIKAVVFCGTNPVAEASGVMSVDIPFAAQNVGEKVAAANIGMLAYGKAGIQTAAGIGTAIASKGKSGWGNILSGGTALIGAYNQLSQVENGNYTEICGKSGDGCALAGVDTIVIKITRPLYGGNTTAPYVPAGFAHTVGFVSMKQSKVNACTGLIVCDNVEVSGISGATDAERAEIKRVLETGLYVNTLPE